MMRRSARQLLGLLLGCLLFAAHALAQTAPPLLPQSPLQAPVPPSVLSPVVNPAGNLSPVGAANNPPAPPGSWGTLPAYQQEASPGPTMLASATMPTQQLYPPDRFADVMRRLDAAEAELRELRGENADGTPADFVNFQKAGDKDGAGKGDAKKPAAGGAKKDEFPTFRITGFTQLDGGWYSQDPTNRATVGNAQDGVGFRRARLAVVGKVAEFTNYMAEFDFATAGHPSFFDVWVEQGNLPVLGTVRGGQYCQPFSVDALTGFRNLTFLERSLPFLAFVPFRRVGFMAYNTDEEQMTTWAYSVFKTGGFNNAPLGDDRFATDIGDVGGYSFSGRATHLLYYDELVPDRYLWHIGGSYDYSRLGANTAAGSPSPVPFYQSKVLPEFGPLGNSETSQAFGQAFAATPVFIDSGKYQATDFNLFGLETLYQAGPLGITAEWMGTQVQSVVGPIFYHGAYVQAGYRLTGENRVYDKKTGTLGKIFPYTEFFSLKPGGVKGWGAFEVAARLSYVDIRNPTSLDGHYLSGTSAAGTGTLTDTTLGLTWFLNGYCKMQFNWIHAMLNNTVTGYSLADLFVTRLQVDF